MMLRTAALTLLFCATTPAVEPNLLFPDFASSGAGGEEIRPPAQMTTEEKGVLASVQELTPDEILDLIQAYERMGNTAMQESLGRALLERVPNHPLAHQLAQGAADKPEIRRPDYLQLQAAEVLAGKVSTDPDAVGTEARSLLAARKPEQAAALLEALQKTTFPGRTFPFQEDWAYALMDLGRWREAEELLKPLGTGGTGGVERRIALIRAANHDDPEKVLQQAEALLAELPSHPAVITFHIECLQYAGRSSDALQVLQALKAASTPAQVFPYQRLLAHCHLQLKQWDAASEAFEQVKSSNIFSTEARTDAAKMVKSIQIAKTGEAALEAAGFGRWEEAENMIAGLQRDNPEDLEVFAYHCALLARTNRADEALRLLEDKDAAIDVNGTPSPLADTRVDIWVAKKNFVEARIAAQKILDNPRQDWSLRRRALDALPVIRKAELMEEGYLALRDRRVHRAEKAAMVLEEEFGPGTRELKLLRAEIHLAQNKTKIAAAELEALAKDAPAGQPFEATSSLALAQLRNGRTEEAMRGYRQILDHPRAYTPLEANQARWLARAAAPQARPGISATAEHRQEQDGTVNRVDASYSGPWWGAWRARVYTHADYLEMKAQFAGIAQAVEPERYEAGAWIQRRFKGNVMGEVLVGSGQDDPLIGARVGSGFSPGRTWSAAFMVNARNTDSIPLEALNARENRAELAWGGALTGPWNVDVRAFMNWVRVATEDVGNGFGGSVAVEHVLRTQTDQRGEMAIGYLGEYRRFSPVDDASPLASLVDPETNRHGITLAWRRAWRDSWRFNAEAGAFYAFDESSLQYTGSLGVEHSFGEELLAYLDVRYDTNSRSAVGDVGAFGALLGMQKTF